jgi:hypothetical protein
VTAKFLVTLNAPTVAGTYDAKILTTSPINGPSVSWTVTVKAAWRAMAQISSTYGCHVGYSRLRRQARVGVRGR